MLTGSGVKPYHGAVLSISVMIGWAGWEADSPEDTTGDSAEAKTSHFCCCCFKDSLFGFAFVHCFFCHVPWHVGSCFPTRDGTVAPALKVQ